MASQAVCVPPAEKHQRRSDARPSVAAPVAAVRAGASLLPPRLSEGFESLYHKALLERQIIHARPLTAAIVLLAHRMGAVSGDSIAAAVNNGDPAALHALSCRAVEGMSNALDTLMRGVCAESHLEALHISFNLDEGVPLLEISTDGCSGIEIPVNAMPEDLARLVFGCVKAITYTGVGVTADELREYNYFMGLVTTAYGDFKQAAGLGFEEWCKSEAQNGGVVADLVESYDDYYAMREDLRSFFDAFDTEPGWIKHPPSLEAIGLEFNGWKDANSPHLGSPWCRFVEKTLEVMPACMERLRQSGGPHYAESSADCHPLGFSQLIMTGGCGEEYMVNQAYEEIMQSGEPMSLFVSLSPVALPWVHAKMEAIAAAQGLLNLAIEISNLTDNKLR